MSAARKNGIRVLVVDDERTIATTLASILEMAGFESRATFSGAEAVELAKTFRPDLLVADYKMPGMNGLDTAVAIKKMLPACRIFMLSGHLVEEDFDSFRKRGYNFLLLSKPIPPSALIDTLKSNADEFKISTNPPKVLNVDDVEMHRYSVSRLLKRAGFEVSEAENGAEAIARAVEQHPDLILLDVNLPDMNGFEVCRRLKSDERTANITVIHVTASSKDPKDRASSSESGADEFVPQPYLPSDLVTHLRSLLQLKYLKQGMQKAEETQPEN